MRGYGFIIWAGRGAPLPTIFLIALWNAVILGIGTFAAALGILLAIKVVG